MIISAILFPLSDILRWTDIVSPALNPKSLEPRQQARASRRRKPKISRAVGWGPPRRPPPRTCQRTGRQRWGTRRKVKRWTTNWLRRKSKKHLALLLFLFLMIWGKPDTEAAKWFDVWCHVCPLRPLPSFFWPFLSLFTSLFLPSVLCDTAASSGSPWWMIKMSTWHTVSSLPHSILEPYYGLYTGSTLLLHHLIPPSTTTTLLASISRFPWLPAAWLANGWLLLYGSTNEQIWQAGFHQLSRLRVLFCFLLLY